MSRKKLSKIIEILDDDVKEEIEETEKRLNIKKEDIFDLKYEDKDIVDPIIPKNFLSFIDLCSGTGGFHTAFDRIKDINTKCLLSSDIDKNCRKVYFINHGLPVYNDLEKIDYNSKDRIDMVCAGFPCFIKDTKVLTDNGYKNIQDVELTDKLLTHNNKFQKILNLQRKNYNSDLYKIRVSYSPYDLNVTEEHPFYVNRDGNIDWLKANELLEDDYVGLPINQNNIIPDFRFTKNINQYKKIDIKIKLDEKDQWFMLGYFVGDGWIEEHKTKDNKDKYKIRFAINNKQEKELLLKFQKYLKLTDKKCSTGKCKKFGCQNKLWFNIFKDFGKYAHNKKIPEWVQDAPVDLLKEFINGYQTADGCVYKNRNFITTTSYNLAYGIQRLFLKTGIICGLDYKIMNEKTIIEGRLVNQRNFYKISWGNKNYKGFIEDGYMWRKIKTIKKEKVENEKVYNFEVENDNSYCVENIIVHNCQPFSVAGKRLGLDDARGTVIHNILKIVEDKTPKIIILENVKGLKSLKNKDQNNEEVMAYKLIYDTLEKLNYYCYDRIISPHEINIPQKRERVVIIGVRKDLVKNKYKDNKDFKKDRLEYIEKLIKKRKEQNKNKEIFQSDKEISDEYKLSDEQNITLDLWRYFVSMKEWNDIDNKDISHTYLKYYLKKTDEQIKKVKKHRKFKQIHFFTDFLHYKDTSVIPKDLKKQYKKRRSSNISPTIKKQCDLLNCLYENNNDFKSIVDKFFKEKGDIIKKISYQNRYLEYCGGENYGQCKLDDFYAQFRMSGLRVRKSEYFPTLVKSGPLPIIIKKNRYITDIECGRLQSFKDNFIFISKTSAIRQTGNAVNTEVIELMIRSVFDSIDLKEYKKEDKIIEKEDFCNYEFKKGKNKGKKCNKKKCKKHKVEEIIEEL